MVNGYDNNAGRYNNTGGNNQYHQPQHQNHNVQQGMPSNDGYINNSNPGNGQHPQENYHQPQANNYHEDNYNRDGNEQPNNNTNQPRNNYQERGPKIKKTFFTTKSLLAIECFPENDQSLLFTILGQGQTQDKKYDPSSAINIKMNLEEIACIIEGIEAHRLGGPDAYLNLANRIHPPKQGGQAAQGLNFYHKGSKFQTSISMNLTQYGGLILFVNRTDTQSPNGDKKNLSFSLLPSIEYSFELTLRSFFQTILSTYRQDEQWQTNKQK